MSIKFGIMQGRLSNTALHVLQKYPKNWEQEFEYIAKTNLDYIEFFAESKINKKNPFWHLGGLKKIKTKVSHSKYKKIILCDNFTIANSFINAKTIKYLKFLIVQLSRFTGSMLIIPIISKKLKEKAVLKKHLKSIKVLLSLAKKMKVKLSFEIDKSFEICYEICKNFSKNKNFGITFDTGNSFLHKNNFYEDAHILRKYINHIHLKDRDARGRNVLLGKGEINFDTFFKYLNKKKSYTGTMTFESCRGKNAIDTANANYYFIKSYLKK